MNANLVIVASWEEAVEAALGGLTQPTHDPFLRPVLVAPGRAQGRALLQRLALQDGVAAGIDPVTPARLRADLERDLLGVDPEADPWSSGALAVRIAAVLDLDEPWLAPVHRHLQVSAEQGIPRAAWTTSRQVATALARLIVDSPDLLERWGEGEAVDATGADLDPARRWWAFLWRHLLDEPSPVADPVRRHRDLLETIDATGRRGEARAPVVWLSSAWTPRRDAELAAALSGPGSVTVIHLDHAIDEDDPWTSFDKVRPRTTRTWKSVFPHSSDGPSLSSRSLPEVVVHDTHGPDRQAEVVREVVCAALADHPELEPRDVVVVCPGDQEVGNLLAAATGPGTTHPAGRLRFSAPPPTDAVNPVTDVVLTVLGLAATRATSQELLDLCAMPAVRTRFGFTTDDLADLERLASDSGIRWGVDSSSRQAVGLGAIRQSTWLAGIERMLLGVAMSTTPPTHLSTVTPIDDVGSTMIPLVGRLAELVSRLRRILAETANPATLGVWRTRLARLVEDLTAPPEGAAWATGEALGLLAGPERVAGDRPFSRQEVRELLSWLARSRSSHRSWFDGSIQICRPGELTPVDHRVVVLVDPDRGPQAADELRVLRPEQSDPSTRERQALLDVAMSARTLLAVVRQARDPVSNLEVLPGPFTTTLSAAAARRGQAIRQCARGLQPFSHDEFSADGSTSFDAEAARAASVPSNSSAPVDRTLLPPVRDLPETRFSPSALTMALSHPARTLLRARTGAPAAGRTTELPDNLPLELNALEQYGVRARLLADLERAAALAEETRPAPGGTDPSAWRDAAVVAERLRGSTPPGELGQTLLNDQVNRALSIARRAQEARGTVAESFVEINLDLNGGDLPPLHWPDGLLTDPYHPVSLRGRVAVRGRTVVHAVPSRPNAKGFLSLWIDLLSVSAATGEPGWTGVLVADGPAWPLLAPDPPRSTDLLAGLARLAWWSCQQFVPLPLGCAFALAGATQMPRPDFRSDRSSLAVQWSRDHDENWAAFIDAEEDDLQGCCERLGTSLEALSAWMVGPILAARRPVGQFVPDGPGGWPRHNHPPQFPGPRPQGGAR